MPGLGLEKGVTVSGSRGDRTSFGWPVQRRIVTLSIKGASTVLQNGRRTHRSKHVVGRLQGIPLLPVPCGTEHTSRRVLVPIRSTPPSLSMRGIHRQTVGPPYYKLHPPAGRQPHRKRVPVSATAGHAVAVLTRVPQWRAQAQCHGTGAPEGSRSAEAPADSALHGRRRRLSRGWVVGREGSGSDIRQDPFVPRRKRSPVLRPGFTTLDAFPQNNDVCHRLTLTAVEGVRGRESAPCVTRVYLDGEATVRSCPSVRLEKTVRERRSRRRLWRAWPCTTQRPPREQEPLNLGTLSRRAGLQSCQTSGLFACAHHVPSSFKAD